MECWHVFGEWTSGTRRDGPGIGTAWDDSRSWSVADRSAGDRPSRTINDVTPTRAN